ncbi:transglycosylase domain-containing protein, partial [uncultured Selenomonas sp.]|uniref:transglycosylase domain-containing protein n=1 Tax=uncultured Selenomonas sp. TaxID=159275 RepID=UPI002606D05B
MKKFKRLLRFSLFLFVVFCLAFLVTGGAAVFRPSLLDSVPKLQEARRLVFLRDAVAERVRQREHYVTIDEMPDSLLDAVVAVEDSRFYSHHGFD